MIINHAKELQELTGSYYASNNFDRIKTDVELETEAIIRLISQPVYDKIKQLYKPWIGGDTLPVQPALVQHAQLPIAIMANFHYMQGNMVTHSDNGRKVKINDKGEKMAWEWMIDKDDQAQLRKAREGKDRLINFLEKSDIQEWKDSEARKASRELFVNSTAIFQNVFPIDSSPCFYYTVVPFLRTIQRTLVKPALGSDYQILLDAWKGNSVSGDQETMLELIQQALPLLAMAMATRRLSLQVMPDSVVQIFRSQNQSLKASNAALEDSIKRFRIDLLEEGEKALDKAKQLRSNDTTEAIYLPKNNACNKYMRT